MKKNKGISLLMTLLLVAAAVLAPAQEAFAAKTYTNSYQSGTRSWRGWYDGSTVTVNNETTWTLSVPVGVSHKGFSNGDSLAKGTHIHARLSTTARATGGTTRDNDFTTTKAMTGTTEASESLGNATLTITKTHQAQTVKVYLHMSHWGTGNKIQSPWLPGSGTYNNMGSTGATVADGLLVKSVTIPAKKSYTVTYDANGGSGAPAAGTKWYGEALTLSSDIPVYEGHDFSGWNTARDGSGTTYLEGSQYTANAAATLYAQWDEQVIEMRYEVTVNGESLGDTFVISNEKEQGGGDDPGEPEEPDRPDLRINKVNGSGQPVAGVSFELSNDEYSKYAVTDESGIAEFLDIEPGGYTLRETNTPAGYIRDTRDYAVTVNNEKAIVSGLTLTNGAYRFVNLSKSVDLKLIKKDIRSGTVLAGAVFSLSGTSDSGQEVALEKTTGTDGQALFSSIPEGTYSLEETVAPDGYPLNSTLKWEVKAYIDDEGNSIAELTDYQGERLEPSGDNTFLIMNSRERNLLVRKVNSVSYEPVEGVYFELRKAGTTAPAGYVTAAEGGGTVTDSNVIDELFTNEDGLVFFTDLPEGMYTMTEPVTPEGMENTDREFTVTVSGNTVKVVNSEDGSEQTIGTDSQYIVQNTPAIYNMRIRKVRKGTETPLKGATFAIYEEGTGKGAEPLITRTTGENGMAEFNDLSPGIYTLSEEKAPEGYYAEGPWRLRVGQGDEKIALANGKEQFEAVTEGEYEVFTIADISERSELKIEKNVTGPLGDRTKAFQFTLEIAEAEPRAMYPLTGDTSGTLTTDADGSGAVSFTLKDDQSVTVELPAFSSYKITERSSDHTASYAIETADSVVSGTGSNNRAMQELSTQEEVISSPTTVTFNNHRDIAIVTGVAKSSIGMVCAGLAGCLALLIYAIRRRNIIG